MNKIFTDKKSFLIIAASCLLLVLSGAGLWFYFSLDRNPSSTATQTSIIDKTPVSAISHQTTSTTSSDVTETSPSASQSNDEKLPPISADMAAQIRQLDNRSTEGLVVVKHKDGSTSMDTAGRFQSVTAAVRDPDGKIIIRHGDEFLNNVNEPSDN